MGEQEINSETRFPWSMLKIKTKFIIQKKIYDQN